MSDQELLLLQLLKVPVIIIKTLSKILSILTYVPNYLIIFIVDLFVFSQKLQASLMLYLISWLPRVVFLMLGLSIFCLEFYLIFSVLQLSQHGILIQSFGMILALAGLLILMRKGYLSMIQKFNLTKLKSPMQHIEVGLSFGIDILNILLTVINCLMVINIPNTFRYDYQPYAKFNYLKHISNLIRDSCISYLQFFYVHIFFKIFPWRFRLQEDIYKKQKKQKNVLNCLVLLTLIYLATMLDLIVIIIFGLPLVIDYQRKVYFQKLSSDHKKWRVTLNQFAYVVLRTVQLFLQALCLPFCWSESVAALKLTINFTQRQKLFGKQVWQLIKMTLLKIPYLFCNFWIFAFRYKYQRKLILLSEMQKQFKQKNHTDQKIKHTLQRQVITFRCFFEQIVDSVFLLLIVLSSFLKPWNIMWLKYVIKDNYEMNRQLVSSYFTKNMFQLFVTPFAILVSFIVFMYEFKKPFAFYKQAGLTVQSKYLLIIKKNSKDQHKMDELLMRISMNSQIGVYFQNMIKSIVKDIPHLPYFIIAKATLLNIYNPSVVPTQTADVLQFIYMSYLLASTKNQKYTEMYERAQIKGLVNTNRQKLRFWKYAHKCKRLGLIQRMLELLLPKASVLKIQQKIVKLEGLSQLSTEYWYQTELTKAYSLKLLFILIQIICSIIGIVFMLPLTLWRFPTFIILYKFHNNKKYFFTILFKMYAQLLKDVITFPLKIIAILAAPKMYYQYVKKTSFNYGPLGLQSFEIYQNYKNQCLIKRIIIYNLVVLIMHLQISVIVLFWIRIKNLKTLLRLNQLNLIKLYKKYIFSSPQIPTVEQYMSSTLDRSYQDKFNAIIEQIHNIFKNALQDMPYLILMAIVFVTMPWRINYIIQTIKDMREDSQERKTFFKLMKNIFKDYACILMNIILLLSVFKTMKAFLLIRRNYRLNFFIGFLQYSYFKQLKNQMVSLVQIYENIFYFVVAVLFGWTKANKIVNQLIQIRTTRIHSEEAAKANKIIHDNTVKSGKQLKLLNKMGYYDYLTVSSFLTIPDIISLRKVDKFNYLMTKREEIWFMKWEKSYAEQNIVSDTFEEKTIIAFKAQFANKGRDVVTYHDVIIKYFRKHVFEETIDLQTFLNDKLSPSLIDKIFKNYRYSLHLGYGPENQLPQAEHQDQQFLRLTNQTRLPKLPMSQNQMFLDWLYQRPSQKLMQTFHRYFRVDRLRRIKQLIFLLSVISIPIGYVSFIWLFRHFIFVIDSLIGVKILLTFYFHTFVYLCGIRLSVLCQNWISLIPFDLFYDFVRLARYIKQLLETKVITPTGNLFKKCAQIIKDMIKKIYNKLVDVAKKIYDKIASVARKTADFAVKYSLLAYEKVVKPLYISIADKLRKLKNIMVAVFQAIYTSIKTVCQFIGLAIKSVYTAIKSIFTNINRLYYTILKVSMTFLLKFGLLGNLLFTIFGLVLMTLPSIIWWTLYQQRWYLIVSTIHTMVLIVVGYKHLNKIRSHPHQQ